MKKKLQSLSSILTWVFFIAKGLKDNTDLMRANILCMDICSKSLPNADKVMKGSGYLGCTNDLPNEMLTKEYIEEIITFRDKELNNIQTQVS